MLGPLDPFKFHQTKLFGKIADKKTMIQHLLLGAVLLTISPTNASDTAGPACYANPNDNSLKPFDLIGLVVKKLNVKCGERRLEIGESCVTSKGFVFKYLGNKEDDELYEDIASGVIWGDKRNDIFKFTKAVAECEKVNGKLPSLKEVYEGEEHGFREVLPHSSYSYTARELNLKLKNYESHLTYWAGDTFTRTRFGFLKFKKAYAYKMGKDYFEAYESPDDADTSLLNIRCTYPKK